MGGHLMVVVGADEGAVERRLPPPNPTMPPSGEHRENRTPNTLLEWCTKNTLIVNYSKKIFFHFQKYPHQLGSRSTYTTFYLKQYVTL
jgi:hypothetical protein